MSRNSSLTPFIANGLRKMIERGVWNYKYKQHIISKPNCLPPRSKGQPLGMEKFASLFAFYLIGLVVSLILLILENIFKPSKPAYLLQYEANQRKIKLLKKTLNTLTDQANVKLYLLNEVKLHVLEDLKASHI